MTTTTTTTTKKNAIDVESTIKQSTSSSSSSSSSLQQPHENEEKDYDDSMTKRKQKGSNLSVNNSVKKGSIIQTSFRLRREGESLKRRKQDDNHNNTSVESDIYFNSNPTETEVFMGNDSDYDQLKNNTYQRASTMHSQDVDIEDISRTRSSCTSRRSSSSGRTDQETLVDSPHSTVHNNNENYDYKTGYNHTWKYSYYNSPKYTDVNN